MLGHHRLQRLLRRGLLAGLELVVGDGDHGVRRLRIEGLADTMLCRTVVERLLVTLRVDRIAEPELRQRQVGACGYFFAAAEKRIGPRNSL